MKARDVRLEESAAAPRHQGVVCSLKDNFGFIERADCVKEIFFHFSEFMGEVSNVNVGDDVEFEIHTRNVSQKRKIFFLQEKPPPPPPPPPVT